MSLYLSSPMVVRLRATHIGGEAEDEFLWKIRISRETFTSGDRPGRTISGFLRADGPTGWGDIDVGGVVYGSEGMADEEIMAAMIEYWVDETLYDFARSHLQPLLATTACEVRIPLASPVETEMVMFPEEPDGASPDE